MLSAMISRYPLLYIGLVQFGFSCLDLFARSSLRGSETFLLGMSKEWFAAWLVLQVAMAPLQIKLIKQNGLGKGVALMNGFSVIFAFAGGMFLLNEPTTWNQVVAVVLVLSAVFLFATQNMTLPSKQKQPLLEKEI